MRLVLSAILLCLVCRVAVADVGFRAAVEGPSIHTAIARYYEGRPHKNPISTGGFLGMDLGRTPVKRFFFDLGFRTASTDLGRFNQYRINLGYRGHFSEKPKLHPFWEGGAGFEFAQIANQDLDTNDLAFGPGLVLGIGLGLGQDGARFLVGARVSLSLMMRSGFLYDYAPEDGDEDEAYAMSYNPSTLLLAPYLGVAF